MGGGGDSHVTTVADGHASNAEGGSPVEFVQFNNSGKDEEVEEIAAANSQTTVVDDAGRPRPQSVPAYGSRGSAMAAVTCNIVFFCKQGTTKEESFIDVNHGQRCWRGGGGQKTKNSTNRERGSISKAMDRMAQSLESGGGGVCYDDIHAVESNATSCTEYFYAAVNVSTADAMQMAAIDKRAETSEKYLHQIAKSLAKKKKHKKGESDEKDDTSDDD